MVRRRPPAIVPIGEMRTRMSRGRREGRRVGHLMHRLVGGPVHGPPRMAPEPLRQPLTVTAAMITIQASLFSILHLPASARGETFPATGHGAVRFPSRPCSRNATACDRGAARPSPSASVYDVVRHVAGEHYHGRLFEVSVKYR